MTFSGKTVQIFTLIFPPLSVPSLGHSFHFRVKDIDSCGSLINYWTEIIFGRKWSCVYIDIFRAKLIEVYLQKCVSFHCINLLNLFECFNMVSVYHPMMDVKWFEREMKCFAKECKLYVLAANMHERYDHNQGKLESNNNISSRYYITILFIEKLARINSDCCYYFFVNRTPFSLFDCISGYCIFFLSNFSLYF